MNLSASANSRFFIGFLISSLLFGSASFAVNAVNTPESGYILCVNKKTQAVTFPGTDKCPKGSSQLLLGAQGLPGVKGDKGDIGLAGVNGASGAQGPTGAVGAVGAVGPVGATGPTGARGSSLLTGVGTPSNQLGDEGDTYIDKNAAQIYGPKKSGIWGYGIGFGGPAGAQGPKGDTGAQGPSGAALVQDLPTNFHQKFRINTSAFGCCWFGNANMKISVTFKNISGQTWNGTTPNPYSTQVWLHFYDENGIALAGSDGTAFDPASSSITTTWNGGNWADNDQYSWLISLTDLYANKPANAVYASVVFRFLNINGFSDYYLNGEKVLTTSFAVSTFRSVG